MLLRLIKKSKRHVAEGAEMYRTLMRRSLEEIQSLAEAAELDPTLLNMFTRHEQKHMLTVVILERMSPRWLKDHGGEWKQWVQ